MALFDYKARDYKGQIVQGQMEAENETIVKNKLRDKNYLVTSINVHKESPLKKFMEGFSKVKLKSLVIFTRQFATMVNSGLSLVRALDVLHQQSDDKKLKEIIFSVREDVEQGSTLADSFGKFPLTFSELFINLIRAGEVGGVLDEVLERLSIFMEKDQELRSKVKSAMTYPAIILVFSIIICAFLIIFILPTFMAMFEEMDTQMPAMTQFLLNISYALRSIQGIIITVVGFAAIFVGLKFYASTDSGRYNIHKIMLKLPVFGNLNQKVAVSRFSQTFGTLLASGVPVMQALEVVAKAAGNRVIEKGIMEIRESIREGENIASPMERTGLFPPMVTQMVAVGEETGNLDKMLMKVAEFYDLEVQNMLDSLTSMLEPVLMVFMGGMVGFIVIAMFLPMFSLMEAIS